MALKLRRGSNAQRLAITPEEGELIYTTDTKAVYVGDGSTVGGTAVTSAVANHFSTIVVAGQSNIVADSTADSLTVAAGSGITLTTDAGTDTLTITNSGLSNLVEDLSPQLGANLDVNGFDITSASGGINILPGGGNVTFPNTTYIDSSGNIGKTGQLAISPTDRINVGTSSIDGNLYLVRNTHSYSFGQGLTFAQHHTEPDAVNFNFYRTRGTSSAVAKVDNGDDIANINFIGQSSSGRSSIGVLIARVDGEVTTSCPGKLVFETRDRTGVLGPRAELSHDGVWRIDQLSSHTGTSITVSTGHSLIIGGISLNQNGLSTTASNQDIILAPSGTGNVSIVGDLAVAGTLGYQTGVGGSVVQLTDKTTTVTLDKPCGSIQLASQSIAAGAEVSFTLLNSYITDRDVVAVSIRSNASAGTYVAQCDLVDNGQCRISLSNISSGPIDQQVVLNFVIIKSVAA
jgi:hypothetical protein